MWLSLLIALLVLGVAVFQATQGAFSALLMCVLSILCAAAAFGAHDWVANHFLAPYFLPDYAHAIALGALFGVPLIGLRILLDRFFMRACPLPGLVDKIAGGLCGLITGQVLVGVYAICLQLVPFGASIVGYSRYELTAPKSGGTGGAPVAVRDDERGLGMGLNPDRFTAALLGVLSNGVFGGSLGVGADYPDYVQAIAWNSAVPPEVSRYAPPKSIAVAGEEPVEKIFRFTKGDDRGSKPDVYDELPAKTDKRLRMVRVQLKNEARDATKSHKFTLRQFRLVGRAQAGGRLEQHFPIAVYQEDPRQPIPRHIAVRKDHRGEYPVVDLPLTPREDNGVVEIVFELPKAFVPDFLEYKRAARAKLTFSEAKTSAGVAAPAGQPPSTPSAAPSSPNTPAGAPATAGEDASSRGRRRSSGETVPDSGQGGLVRTATTISGSSFFGDALPMTLKSYRAQPNTDTGSETLRSGHLVAEVAAQAQGTDQPVAKFGVPKDKRLLHLSVKALHARSGLGRILSQAIAVAQNFFVTDAQGRQYVLAGKYAVANVRGKDVFEVMYFPETEEGATGRAGNFQRIKESDLGDGDQLVLLFLVEPGAQIVSFSTGGSASRSDDLRAENLVAPK